MRVIKEPSKRVGKDDGYHCRSWDLHGLMRVRGYVIGREQMNFLEGREWHVML